MPSVYPGALDALNNPTATTDLDDGTVPHAQQHANSNDAIEAIQAELGTLPKGSAASVKARLDAMDTLFGNKVNTSLLNAVSGVATLDSSTKLVQNVDAAKVNSGTLAIARIPLLTSNKIDPASGAFPVGLIPSLGAGQITSGVFPTARIPGLPGSWITSGTISAAFLPSSVTANANARVVADLAGRDAIPVIDRVDGMLVIQKDRMIIWTYRADNTSWVLMPNVQNAVLGVARNAPLSGTWGDITGLSFNALNGETYAVDVTAFAICSGSSGVDIRYGWSWTGAGSMDSGTQGPDATVVSPNTSGPGQWGANLADVTTPLQPNSVTGAMGLPSGLNVTHRVYATYRCTGTGVVQLQAAQDISNASFAATVSIGSRLRAERIL